MPAHEVARRALARLDESSPTSKAAAIDGAMVALRPARDESEALAVLGGEPAENLHVTVAFLASDADLIRDRVPELLLELRAVARRHEVTAAQVAGCGYFTSDGEDEPVVALVDAPGLDELRVEVADACARAGAPERSEHGFIPHVTLAYVPAGTASAWLGGGEEKYELPLTFDELELHVGGDVYAIPLGSPSPAAESPTLAGYDVRKSDTLKRYTLGPVYMPRTLDAHNEFMVDDTLEDMILEFGRRGDRTLYLQHTTQPAGELVGVIVWPDAYTTTVTVPGQEPQEITFPAGTAYAGVVWDEATWPRVERGEIRGFSFGGRGFKQRVEVLLDD